MTRTEFDRWFIYHQEHFPGMAAWLGRMEVHIQDGHMNVWFKALRNVNPEHAHDASDKMFDDVENDPHSYERHPQAIARIASGLKAATAPPPRQYVDGEETYKCLLCQDDGRVIVWDNVSTAVAGGKMLYQAAAACTCVAGDYFVERAKTPMVRYNPKRMQLCFNTEPASREAAGGDDGRANRPGRPT